MRVGRARSRRKRPHPARRARPVVSDGESNLTGVLAAQPALMSLLAKGRSRSST